MSVQLKDPDEVLDWTHDWSDELVGSEVISASSWTVTPTGTLTIDTDTNTTTTSTVWLSAGTIREVYQVTNEITTDAATARTYHRTIILRVEER